MRKPELLIPASSLEVLKTAVSFGADAVYIGGEAFGLRAKAKNFSKEDMREGIAFAHAHGVKVYVTVNILAHNRDLEGVREYLQELKEIGMDVSVEIPAQTDWAGQMAFLIGWGSPFDADDHTYKVFGTDKGANYSSYSNEEVDKYLTEARQSADPEVRKEAYANFQKALAEDPAYAMICYIDANYVADSNIKGINPDTIMGHHGVGIFWNVADWTIE